MVETASWPWAAWLAGRKEPVVSGFHSGREECVSHAT